MVDVKDLTDRPEHEILLICTGSQGEPLAALARMAARTHPDIHVGKGDTVLLASSQIPGNENAISRVINGLTRWGASVVHKGNAKVHVSGHASAGELAYCYNLVRPRHVLPVHGEWRHLSANADLAVRTGIAAERVLLAEDGLTVDLVDGHAAITGKVPAGYVYVDGTTVGTTTEVHLKDRRTLAAEGMLTIVAIVNADTGELVEKPDFLTRGFVEGEVNFDDLVPVIEATLQEAAADAVGDAHDLEQRIRAAASRWIHRRHRRTPLVIPVVIDA